MKISVTKTTKYSHNGYEVVEYQAGQQYDVDDDCARTAIGDKWATAISERAGRKPATKPAAKPDNGGREGEDEE